MAQNLYIGTYTQDPSGTNRTQGVFLGQFDPASGHIENTGGFDAGPNPSFLALHPNGQYLYVVNEQGEGGVSALAVDPRTGRLTLLNSQPVQGADPCYLSVDPSGKWLLVACYSSGSLAVLPLGADGKIGPLAERVQHEGNLGPNHERQEKAHAHSIRFDPTGRFVLAADLGQDRVWVYRLDEATGKLTPNTPPGLDGKPGAGPRHTEFHPNGKFIYISNELDNTVTACTWDAQTGTIHAFQALSTLPADFKGEDTVADIHITPSGEYLYVSSRGDNSLAAYQVDAATGRLTLLEITPCGGNWPRNFAIDPSGQYLIVANQYSGDLVTFAIGKDGRLKDTGQKVSVTAPVCVKFA